MILRLWGLPVVLALLAGPAAGAPLAVVAAENVYGDVASQIGGADVSVMSILDHPNQDPHLFEASASVARALAVASIAIANGGGYDPWMASLLAASPNSARKTLVVTDLTGQKPGANPHRWYDPAAMPVVAGALAAAMASADAPHEAAYRSRLAGFQASLAPLSAKIAAMRQRFAGVPIAATEPIFGPMAAALGLSMHEARFQLAVMNGTEPGASDVAAFEDDLRGRRVRALITNTQVSNLSVARLVALAKNNGVPVVGVTETLPPSQTYQSWMLEELASLEAALSRSSKRDPN